MSNLIRRVFVEKKVDFVVEATALYSDLRDNLGIEGLDRVRLLNRYDVSGVSEEEFNQALNVVMSEPPVDSVYLDDFSCEKAAYLFAVEYLPGQYDQRADSTAQCIELIAQKGNVLVKTAKVYALYGKVSADEFAKIKQYCINPVEAREAQMQLPESLELSLEVPSDVKVIDGFMGMPEDDLVALILEMGLAMRKEDLQFCQEHFKKEKRDPSVTEIRVLDTYWSDHCRHTTFNTIIDDVKIVDHKYTAAVQIAYELYMEDREEIYGDEISKRPVTLMDIAVLGMKKLRAEGKLDDLDQSEEINACSINVPVEIDGKKEDWLIMFKNETHNHPTEIEPFGGAATCLGGAIRDPLSGRAYVYQAMRITGGADPRTPIEETLEGKLPQRKIALGAAAGYSSYGNQIGIATGRVQEFYHERFLAKRMELGAVIGAVPKDAVVRQVPADGDKVILLGGRTGRDGCGGATGSSKEHTLDSLSSCGAEVQKGNAITERKMLRLFRNAEVTRMVKRCNDFGAGGVSVAIGELADGVKINLDLVPKKYEGLDGTELAISESQERLALVVSAKDSARLIELASQENLEATVVAEVTAEKRMVMNWRGKEIVNLSREFLNTNGVEQHAKAVIKQPVGKPYFDEIPLEIGSDVKKTWLENLARLEVCSQKGIVERFDSTVGRSTVLMPLGGKNQLTPAEGMVANVAVLANNVNTATVMAYGYNPSLASWSPFYGALYAVIESICRATALGADPNKLRLSLQEYFEKMVNEDSWGKPFEALLGAYLAQIGLDVPAIGGKDSMSGTFMELKVPPTLVSFAVGTAKTDDVISSEFKNVGSKVVFLSCERDENNLPDFAQLKMQLEAIHRAILDKKIVSASTIKEGGIAATISLMCFGNDIGFEFKAIVADLESLFILQPAGFIFELADDVDTDDILTDFDWIVLGSTTNEEAISVNDEKITLQEAKTSWQQPLENVFPTLEKNTTGSVDNKTFEAKAQLLKAKSSVKPKVFLPVFPGTNCEYDVARAFTAVGADVDTFVVQNFDSASIIASVKEMAKKIESSQIIALAGGFSAADEPDGSGKFIATMFRNPYLEEAVMNFLTKTDGLMIGICNGFQALVKLGLLPYGTIADMQENSPTMTFNAIGRHVSTICQTKVVSNLSPWLALNNIGDTHMIPLSSGEGRFFATKEEVEKLFATGQVATQYVDFAGKATMQAPHNPNGSVMAIEGLTSADGRIFGKMAHSERWMPGLLKNIPGEKDQKIFQAGINYFS